MRSPYGLEVVERCEGCARAGERSFCYLPEDALRALDALKFTAVYPKGALLFVEGQPSRGVYLLCSGRVKLTATSSDARVIITRIAEPGEILGLSAALSSEAHEVTAETVEPCQINFVRVEDFMRFLSEHGEASLKVARQLGRDYRAALEQVRMLGLSHSAAAKFARFLLGADSRAPNRNGNCNGAAKTAAAGRLKLTLTHEEIGQLIGASRETVTRLFSEFKSERLIEVNGATLLLNNRPALQALANY
jgi:CRP/FNR family transcriptional regulator